MFLQSEIKCGANRVLSLLILCCFSPSEVRRVTINHRKRALSLTSTDGILTNDDIWKEWWVPWNVVNLWGHLLTVQHIHWLEYLRVKHYSLAGGGGPGGGGAALGLTDKQQRFWNFITHIVFAADKYKPWTEPQVCRISSLHSLTSVGFLWSFTDGVIELPKHHTTPERVSCPTMPE